MEPVKLSSPRQPLADSTVPPGAIVQNRKLIALPTVKYWERNSIEDSTFQNSGSSHGDREYFAKSSRLLMCVASLCKAESSMMTRSLGLHSTPSSRASSAG